MKLYTTKVMLLAVTLSTCLFAQLRIHYPYGKIILKSGFIVEGKNLTIDRENVLLRVQGNNYDYKLGEINSIFSGKKRRFNIIGAIAGTELFLVTFTKLGIEIGDEEVFLPISVGGGVTMGFLTPTILSSVGVSKIQWKLLYSSE